MPGVTNAGIRYPDGATKANMLGAALKTFAEDVTAYIVAKAVTGPRGETGIRGPQGLPSPGTVPADTAIAAFVATPGTSETKSALTAFDIAAMVDIGLIPRPPMATPPRVAFLKAQGLSVAAVANGGSGYAVGDEITLAGGEFSYPAVVKVATVSAGKILTVTTTANGIYTTPPANPAAQSSTTGAGIGATFTGTWSGTPSHLRSRTGITPTNAGVRFTGNGPADKGGGYYGNTVGNATACLWEWESDSAEVDLQLGGANLNATLYIDGQRVKLAPITTPADGARYVYALDFGGAKQMRSYRLFSVNSALAQIGVVSGSVVRQPAPKKLAWGLGDSYMFGNGADNISMAAFNIMCEQLGIEGLPDGIGGAGWTGSTAGTPAQRVAAKLATITRAPDYVFFDMGYNNSSSTAAAIISGFDEAVAAVRAAAPLAKIRVFGPATPLGETPALAAVKATVSARCLSLGIPFIDCSAWVTASNKDRYTGADNTHPSPLGHVYLGAQKAAAVRPYIN